MAISINVLRFASQHSSLEVVSDAVILPSVGTDFLPVLYPGQPLALRWHYRSVVGEAGRLGPITATVETDTGGFDVYASIPISYQLGGVSEQVNGIIPPTAAAGKFLYQLGNPRTLVLRAGPQNNPAAADQTTADYAVVDEEFWKGLQWKFHGSPANRGFAWKEPYTVAPIFTNISSWVMLDGTAILFESDDANGPWAPVSTPISVKLGPGITTTLPFPERTQDWSWLVPWVWYPKGPTAKVFHYSD